MKKLLKYIPIIGLFMWACNPMDDIYTELDAKIEPYKENVQYTLTGDDYSVASKSALTIAENESDSAYAKSIASKKAFNQKYGAADFVAPIVGARFPALNLKSTALVTYNIFEIPEYIIAYEMADKYKVTSEDYVAIGGDVAKSGYFFPSEPAGNHIPGILASAFPSATADQFAYVTYNLSDVDPAGAVTLLNEGFEDYAKYDTINKNGWSVYSLKGTHAWQGREFSGNRYAQASAFGSTGEEDFYMISPSVDLSNSVENTFTFDVNPGFWNYDCLEILISDDYDGSNFLAATWDNVTSNFTIPTSPDVPTDGYGPGFVNAKSMSLSGYTGTIYVAFKYIGNGVSVPPKSTTEQIDNVLIKGVESTKKSAKAADYLVYNDMYKYNGSLWAKDNGSLVLDPADYAQMGIPNFSSSASPANYLPQYLSITLPFAQEGAIQAISYEYGASVAADEYILSSGMWKQNGPIFEKADQFVYAESGWLFDPTIKFDINAGDYQALVDYVYASLSRSYGSSYGNDEFYYGASAYYVNFDLRLSNRATYAIPGFEGLSTEAGIALSWERVEEAVGIILTSKYPEAVSEVSGVTVYYWVTFKTYEDNLSKNIYTGIFKFNAENVFERDTFFEDQMVTDGKLTQAEVNWNR